MQTISHAPPCILTTAQEVIYIQMEKPYFSGGGGLLHYLPSLPTAASFHRFLQLLREDHLTTWVTIIHMHPFSRSDSGTYHAVRTEVIIKAPRRFNREPCLPKLNTKVIIENSHRHTYILAHAVHTSLYSLDNCRIRSSAHISAPN